jgi:imidazolonepropionase
MRLEGASYAEVARAGGGILSTVRATRAASEEALLAAALPRVDALIAEGHDPRGEVGLRARHPRPSSGCCASPAASATCARSRRHQLPRRPRGARWARPRHLHRLRRHPDPAPRPRRGPCRRGRRLLRGHRLHPRPDRPRLRPPPASSACRSSCTPSSSRTSAAPASSPRRAASRPTTSNTSTPKACGDGGGRHRGGAAARRLLHPARDPGAAGRGPARRRRADGGGDRLQPRLLAADLAPARDEHGLHPLPPDAGGGARRHATRNAARALGLADRGRIAPGLRADLAVWDVEDPAALAYRIGFNPLHARIFGGRE